MGHRTATWLAWPLWALIVAGIFLGFLLWPVSEGALIPLALSTALPFATVGALVASRRPHNPVGWLFIAFGAAAPRRRFDGFLCDTPLASSVGFSHIQLSIVPPRPAALAPLAYRRVGERDQLRDSADQWDAGVRVPLRVHLAGEHVVCKTVVHRLPRRSCCHSVLVFVNGHPCDALRLRWLACVEVASIGRRGASTTEVGCLLGRPSGVYLDGHHPPHHSAAGPR